MTTQAFPAKTEALNDVLGFVEQTLESLECPMKLQMALCVAIEEVFVNVANYASTTLSHWRINEYGGDGISDHFGVPNALKDDAAGRLPYDITFKPGYR